MSPPTTARQSFSTRTTWIILTLLVISGFLNYFDRSNLSVGATDIQRELHLNNEQLGMLLSAFFWTYAASQLFLIAGWMVERFHVSWILAGGFFLWSGATALTGAAHAFSVLFAMRLLLGMGESIAYPSYSRILANDFPEEHRGFANAAIDAGTKMGPALGTLIGGLLMVRYGWRAFFVGLGFSSFLWLIPWMIWMPRGKHLASRQGPHDCPSVFQIFRHRSAWSSALGLFCGNYLWYFLITWLPAYLETERHFSKTRMAVFASLPFCATALSALIAGRASDHLIARGHTPTVVRKGFAGVGLALSTLILLVAVVRDDRVAMAVLIFVSVCFGLYTANLFAITQTLAGPRAAGKWTSVQNGFGNLAGVVAPWLTGFVVQQTGQFYLAFLVTAAVALAAAGFFVLGIGPVREICFDPGYERR